MLNKKVLGTFALTMISIAAIINLRGLPLMASMGLSSVSFYLAAALLFLIPSGLVCAELATTFSQAGGIYLWVKKAFGDNTGFLAIWLEWLNNVISFPASLSFMAATLAYIINPTLAQHKVYLFSCTLIILWSATFFNLLGVRASSRLNMFGALLGTLIPGALIIFLGGYWLSSHQPAQISFSYANLFPSLHFSNFIFFAGVVSGYAGMQITAFHAPNVRNPQRNYTHSILIAVILILFTTIFASLAIAVVVPKGELSLVAGLMEGFNHFFQAFHLQWATPLLALLIVIGGFSTLSAWLMGPARGLAVAAKNGHFFKFFAKENDKSAPVPILILQSIIASLFATVFLFMPNASHAFWMLLDMSSQSTLLMYILVFASAIRLRYSEANIVRPFKIPGGTIGIWLIAGAAIIICTIALITSFTPPLDLIAAEIKRYESILIASNILYLSIPFIIMRYLMRQKVN
jgi:amino acid transporter